MPGEAINVGEHVTLDDTGYGSKSKAAAPLIRADKPMEYVSLHHHSTFSTLDGFGMPEAHMGRAAELNMSALALTDHGTVSGHVALEKAGNKYGIKPIFGVELYTGDVTPEGRTQRKNHLTVLARTQEGYRNLLGAVSRAWDNFYYEPTIDGATLAQYRSGLFVLSGCQGSLLATSLIGGKNVPVEDASYKRAKAVAIRFKREFGEAYFLEVQAFPGLENSCIINQYYERLSEELSIPLVASCDVHYTIPSDSEMQQILHNVRGGNKQTLEEQARAWGYDVKLCPPQDDKDILSLLRGTGLSKKAALGAIESTKLIAQDCNVVIPKLERVRFPLPEGWTDPEAYFDHMVKLGWKFRGFGSLGYNEGLRYRERLAHEMKMIKLKDFSDYFLVVADAVIFAKEAGIAVGPARGSAAASLVCYLLRITEVNPMLFPQLIFERFIDITREDLPDIDLDFCSVRRNEVRDHLSAKYGHDKVANIGTFTKYKAKNSLDDIGRVYKIPGYKVEEVKGYMLERSSGDLRANSTIEDTVDQFPVVKAVFDEYPELYKAMRLEGNYRGFGVHAAGLVVSSDPITDVCALYSKKDSKTGEMISVISLDMNDATYLNVLKIDALALSTMTLISEACQMIGITLQELYDVPLDDPEVIRGFQDNDVVGIFQFDGRAMRSVTAEVHPDSFKEVADINALARPGPLHGGATAEYIDVKMGRKEPFSYHPLVDEICKDTFGQIVYQEQILAIVKNVGNFDWTHASYIRKIISKKIGEQAFEREYERFREGANSNGLTDEQARAVWNSCITAGSYAFNAAHSYSYGMLAWWTMWLKRKHPQQFYVAALRTINPDKHLELLKDAARNNIEILNPDLRKSQASWTAEKRGIRAGFTQIKGIGDKTAERIMEYRDANPAAVWESLIAVTGIGAKTIEMIMNFVLQEDPFEIFKMGKVLAEIRSELRKGVRDGKGGHLPRATHRTIDVPYSRGVDTKVVWTGYVTSKNLKDIFELHYSKTGEELDPESQKDPELREFMNLMGVDETDIIVLTVDRWRYPRFKQALWAIKPDDVVLVLGLKKGFQARRAIYIHDLWVLGD